MTKIKKPTLKEEFFKYWEITKNYPEPFDKSFIQLRDGIWNLFEPHLKKSQTKAKIAIDQDSVKNYIELFPDIILGSGKRARCSVTEVTKAFEWFFKNYPDALWENIFIATKNYLNDQHNDGYKFTRTSKYFVVKWKTPSVTESELAEYYNRVVSGDNGPIQEEEKFTRRVY